MLNDSLPSYGYHEVTHVIIMMALVNKLTHELCFLFLAIYIFICIYGIILYL
jgi:hypothetical protein